MNYPDLKFQLDMGFDQWTGDEFMTFSEEDIFSNSVLEGHPKLKACKNMEKDKRKDFINKYVSEYYKKHKKELDDTVKTAKEDWAKVSNPFYKSIDKLFSQNGKSKYTWLEGNCICFLSIFNCGPRFIKDKFFQTYYKHGETINYACMHEMLHFAFYDYMKKNFLGEYKTLGEDGIWKLSEIFNDVVLREPDFVEISKQPNPTVYPENEEGLEKFKMMWEQNSTVNTFIKAYLNTL